MILHQDKELFRDAVQSTAEKMGIKPIYVEKDYWVTYALKEIFNHSIGKETVFKGGTALSKCYNMIERFSEDIDLIVLRRAGETDNKLKTKLKTLSTVAGQNLPELQVEGITHKRGMNRKTAHTYAKAFQGDYGQVRDVVVLESTWLGYYEPHTTKSIISFVGKMMLDNGQESIAEANGLLAFELQVLEPTRTICEKIMSLVRFSYGENPIEDLKKKVRHIYDLQQLLQQKEFVDFFESSSFDAMLIKVANDDVTSFRNNNQWLVRHPGEALMFKDLANVWDELKLIYNGDFKNLVYGNLPNEADVLVTLNSIKNRLATVKWNIQIENNK